MKINISSLTFDCIIGILDFERETPQKVILDISFEYDYNNSSSFIDYSIIAKDVENIMIEQKFELLEDAIIQLENYFKKNYKTTNLKIKISKPNILSNCIVSLEN